ncbi:MAG: SdrD B-like domain-containing protein, partial [candidate division NC10 bacterium]|nr:SdrD B-like domain-containing protein [candidate division NC10 bacterium]
MEKDDFPFFEFPLRPALILALSLLSAFVSSPATEALAPGSATFEFQYRLTDVDPQTGPSTSRQESNYRFSFDQETINWGRFSGFINWLDEPFYHRRGSWLLEFRDFYLDQTRLDAALGDSFFRLSLIGDPPFRFSNLLDPDLVLEGARAHLTSERGEMELLAGDLVALRGAFATGVEYLDETVVGVRSRYFLVPGLRLGGQFLRTGRSEDQDQISEPIYRRNEIYSLSAEFEPWPGYRLLQGEFSLSRYQKLEEDKDRNKGWDYSLILGPSIRIPQLTFDANFRHIGPDYRPFSRFYSSDQEGFFFSGEYRPRNFLSLFASADRYHNNLKEDPDRATLDTGNAILGLRVGAPPFPLLSFRYGVTERESRRHSPTKTDSRLQNYTAEISYDYWAWHPLFRFQRFTYEDRFNRASDYQSNLYFLEVRKGFADSSYAWVNGEWNRYEWIDSDSVTDTYTLRLGADYRFLPAIGVRGEASYSRARDNLHWTDAERKGILLAISAALPWNFNLYGEYGYTRVDDRIGVNDRDEHRLYIRASQRVNWGQRPVIRGPLPPGAPPPGYGSILGVTFNDRNGNGIRDEGEPPVPGIRIQLEDGSVAVSDEEGKFSFTNLLMGEHTLSLDTKR